ncbi:MAG: RDD family protein [Candidatus Nitronauta litoralis]|uniref:RDD family protein n=1 Tax=Candidatus Nitronauta litoralis TaxID=2705533 RepID=A0A7T0BTV0_9BACT|nr:MAG: RDD family protein [Candidatus Nitronauta litoralis]
MTAPGSNQIFSMELAGFGRRYLAFAVDALFLEILGVLVSSPFVGIFRGGRVLVPADTVTGSASDIYPVLILSYLGIGAVLWSLYFTCFNGYADRTPGKALFGLRVCHLNGVSIKPATALARFWASLLFGTFTLGLSYSWAAWDRWRQAWHDKFFNTVVIRKATS